MPKLSSQTLLFCLPSGNEIIHIPEPISDSGGHGWRSAESAINFDEVVREISQSNGSDMVLQFLAQSVSQTGEAPRRHANAKIVPLNVARADVSRVRVPHDRVPLTASADSGRVALFGCGVIGIDLHQHRVVNLTVERLVYGPDVHFQSIARELNAIAETASEVFNELSGTYRVTLADEPARD